MASFMCQLGWTVISNWLVRHQLRCCVKRFSFKDVIYIQISRFWIKQITLKHVGWALSNQLKALGTKIDVPLRRKKGFPGGADGKEPACQCRRHKRPGSIPGLGRSPGGGHGNPLQYSCLENPMDRGAWRAAVHGVAKSRTQLSDLAQVGKPPLDGSRRILAACPACGLKTASSQGIPSLPRNFQICQFQHPVGVNSLK